MRLTRTIAALCLAMNNEFAKSRFRTKTSGNKRTQFAQKEHVKWDAMHA
jgi:hypothetical protein